MLELDYKKFDFILDVLSENYKDLLNKKVRSRKETALDIIKALENIIPIKGVNLPRNDIEELKKTIFTLSDKKIESKIKNIISQFRDEFPFKIMIYRNGLKESFYNTEEIVKKLNKTGVLFLQCNEKIGKEYDFKDFRSQYLDLYLNLDNEEGLFFFTKNYGVFISLKNFSLGKIKESFNRVYKKFITAIENNTEKNHKKDTLARDALKEMQKDFLVDDVKIFHLSDLHLLANNHDDYNKQRIKKTKLFDKIKENSSNNNIFLITGDLVDTPTIDNLSALRGFKQRIENIEGNNLTYYTNGNHDVKIEGHESGNLDENYMGDFHKIIDYNNKIEVIDKLKLIIIKVDSCYESTFSARGRIGRGQLQILDTLLKEYDQNYRKIVLLHHHPVEIKRDRSSFFQLTEVVKDIGRNYFIDLIDSEEFLKWVEVNNINYVFHGHKHVPNQDNKRNALIVGAGSALSVKEEVYQFNLIKYYSDSRWNIYNVVVGKDKSRVVSRIEKAIF